jgi:Flp pilus assembly protein TadG
MAIQSGSIKAGTAAVDIKVVGSTSQETRINKLDVINFSNGTGANQCTAIVDPNITISANSTTITFGNLTTTQGAAWNFTELKGYRLYNADSNGNITVTSTALGLNGLTLPPGTFMAFGSNSANGLTVSNATTVIANGTNGNILVLTMFVS